jgi:NADPH:quinone reductase-like Zn-dependent oxidoreductase
MRAIQITEYGGPDVLRLRELPDPEPGDGELLVQTAPCGVNYIDTYHRCGAYPVELPFTPGMEGAGVAAVYDGVGATTFDASLASLRPRGMLALFGAASGPVPPVDPQRLNAAGSVFLTRPQLAHYTATREELTWRAGEVYDAVRDGSLRITVGGRYPLGDARRAHEDLQGRRTSGKLLLLPR